MSSPFAVVYFDGETEIDVGNVMVDPFLNFKKLQLLLSQRIGISPHQFSVYLASLERNRKIPITAKVNFAAIAREKDAFFFVKRSSRPRRHKTHKESGNDECDSSAQQNQKNPPENVMLLRRNAATDLKTPILDRVEYEKRVRNLRIERERYLINMGLSDLWLGREWNGGGERNRKGGGVVCEECWRGKRTGKDVGFHGCVYDAVTAGFRSPAGPIARPMKGSG